LKSTDGGKNLSSIPRILAVYSPYLLSIAVIVFVSVNLVISSDEIILLIVAFLLSAPSGYYDISQYLEKQKSDPSLDYTIQQFKSNLTTITSLHAEVKELKKRLINPFYENSYAVQQQLKQANRTMDLEIEEAKMRIKHLENHISTYAPTHPISLSSALRITAVSGNTQPMNSEKMEDEA